MSDAGRKTSGTEQESTGFMSKKYVKIIIAVVVAIILITLCVFGYKYISGKEPSKGEGDAPASTSASSGSSLHSGSHIINGIGNQQ